MNDEEFCSAFLLLHYYAMQKEGFCAESILKRICRADYDIKIEKNAFTLVAKGYGMTVLCSLPLPPLEALWIYSGIWALVDIPEEDKCSESLTTAGCGAEAIIKCYFAAVSAICRIEMIED